MNAIITSHFFTSGRVDASLGQLLREHDAICSRVSVLRGELSAAASTSSSHVSRGRAQEAGEIVGLRNA